MASATQRPNHPHARNGEGRRGRVWSRQGTVRPVWQSILIGASALFLGLGLLGFLWTFARPLALAILGITIAAALAPGVRWVARLLPRVVAIALLYLLLFLLIGGLVWLVLPSFSNEMQGFSPASPTIG